MKKKHEGLSDRHKCCIMVSGLYAVHRRSEAHAVLRRFRRDSSASPLFVGELFLHLSLVLGYPAMLEGLEAARVSIPHSARRARKSSRGRVVFERIYGSQTDKLLFNLSKLHPEAQSIIVKNVYGRVFTRPGLTLKERELINVTVLSLQGFSSQLYSHLRGAFRVGVSLPALRQALRLNERTTRRSLKRARTVLESVVSLRKKV